MKRFSMFLVFLLFIACTGQSGPDNDLKYYDIHGKVNHLTIYHFDAVEKDGQIVKGDRNIESELDQTLTFDKKGNITQAYFYGEADSLDTRIIRNYDERHLCIEEVTYNDKDEKLSEWIWLYDDAGNNTQRIRVLPNRTLFNAWFLHYNDHGQLISRKSYRNPDSGLYDSLHWVLDEHGRQAEEASYGYYGMYGTNKIEYKDKTELPVRICMYDNIHELTNIVEMDYNDHDLLSEARQMNADSVLVMSVKFDYTYDEKGNWITRVQYTNDQPLLYQERRIIYY